MERCIPLGALRPGEGAAVRRLTAEGPIRRRFLDLGLVEGAAVACVGRSPLGDPAAYLVGGAVIAIRRRDAAGVLVCPR